MTTLAYVDCESTGLDPRIHQPYEVSVWREDAEAPMTLNLPHSLEYADQVALRIGGYHDRGFTPYATDGMTERRLLIGALTGVTLVGSNPAFDAAMLTRFIGAPVWHHRMIDVAQAGMWTFGWDRPKGLADVADACRDRGYDIPAPDHTAEGDVRATRAVYEALLDIRRPRATIVNHPRRLCDPAPVDQDSADAAADELQRLHSIGQTRRDLITDDDWAWFCAHPLIASGHLSSTLPPIIEWLRGNQAGDVAMCPMCEQPGAFRTRSGAIAHNNCEGER